MANHINNNQNTANLVTIFPIKLHRLLSGADQKGYDDVVSWLPGGKSFKVHDKERFSHEVMPSSFGQVKYRSFQKNLNMWSFHVVSRGPNKGACSHPLFRKDSLFLCHRMARNKSSRRGNKQAQDDTARDELKEDALSTRDDDTMASDYRAITAPTGSSKAALATSANKKQEESSPRTGRDLPGALLLQGGGPLEDAACQPPSRLRCLVSQSELSNDATIISSTCYSGSKHDRMRGTPTNMVRSSPSNNMASCTSSGEGVAPERPAASPRTSTERGSSSTNKNMNSKAFASIFKDHGVIPPREEEAPKQRQRQTILGSLLLPRPAGISALKHMVRHQSVRGGATARHEEALLQALGYSLGEGGSLDPSLLLCSQQFLAGSHHHHQQGAKDKNTSSFLPHLPPLAVDDESSYYDLASRGYLGTSSNNERSYQQQRLRSLQQTNERLDRLHYAASLPPRLSVGTVGDTSLSSSSSSTLDARVASMASERTNSHGSALRDILKDQTMSFDDIDGILPSPGTRSGFTTSNNSENNFVAAGDHDHHNIVALTQQAAKSALSPFIQEKLQSRLLQTSIVGGLHRPDICAARKICFQQWL